MIYKLNVFTRWTTRPFRKLSNYFWNNLRNTKPLIMDFFDALNSRKSCRYFNSDELVPQNSLEKILTAAGKSASSKNVQPWGISLLQGEPLNQFKEEYLKSFDEKRKPNPPFNAYPEPLPDVWKALAREVGFSLFAHKGIERRDIEKRQLHYRENALFFHAPQLLYLTTRKDAERGTLLDCGMFLGSLLNGLVAEGFACCSMYFGVMYPEIVAKHISLSSDEMPICAIAIGKEAGEPVNEFRSSRRPLKEWFTLIKN